MKDESQVFIPQWGLILQGLTGVRRDGGGTAWALALCQEQALFWTQQAPESEAPMPPPPRVRARVPGLAELHSLGPGGCRGDGGPFYPSDPGLPLGVFSAPPPSSFSVLNLYLTVFSSDIHLEP